ncbi:glutathione S-transferase domain-containing protein [Thozetella sp. PMI_491]|nr:glutathione S-transferase domain-containing protein [Thozetella sp. PMI_491]
MTARELPYELIYWPGDPGRGEHVRLALEYANIPYRDTALVKDGFKAVFAQISDDELGDAANPPGYAPPMLKHGDLFISQTPNILMYLGPQLGLVPGIEEDPRNLFRVNQLVLTALDGLSNEVHDCHHPIGTGLYYEEQKDESIRRSTDWVYRRLPLFLGYFERVLRGEASGEGPWLFKGKTSYADLVLYQCINGTRHQFPKAIKAAQESGRFDRVFQLYDAVENLPKIKEYLASSRRQKYGPGIYRNYPELDVFEGKFRNRVEDIQEMTKVYEMYKHLLPQ